ncbi:DUF418 domain-containing protein [Streptomyces sp. NPDC097619]|uniref:DUF418 domain-containing protein n=1 Tax=Streptomyces sp. NPDC097619 TaxID=3157228 RepID=UPI003321EAD1
MYRAFLRRQDESGGPGREPGSMANPLPATSGPPSSTEPDTAVTTPDTAVATPPAGPRRPARLPLLDVLRGTAILGTLMTNIWVFAGPGAEWGVLSGFSTEGAGLPATVFRFLADGKFLSLLTILFGAGLAIQYGAAARRGRPWPGSYRPRALFLLAEGTLHFALVFAWDVLMGYAVTALVAARLLVRSERVRDRVMWAALGVHLALVAALTLLLLVGPDGDDGGPSERVVELYAHGSYVEQVRFRLENALALRMEAVFSFGLLLFLFLLGVRLFRAGAFADDERGRRIRGRLLVWGLGLGLPLNAACTLGGSAFFAAGRYGAAPLVALGYLGLTGWVLDRVRRPGPLTRALTAVGRTALSCYVLQNLLAMLACYGIGLGLAARFGNEDPWWVMGLWLTICLILAISSSFWLKRHQFGPLESLQKRLIGRGRLRNGQE